MKDGKITLLIMAAGMGSRYGGLKQADPVDEEGDVILHFSVRDAIDAGFEKVVFVIRREHLDLFREKIGGRIESHIETVYAFQELTDLPEGYFVPEGRQKPWGTAHAVRAARKAIDGPFAVINADDYYGKSAFRSVCDFLKELRNNPDGKPYRFAMAGFYLKNTLTENGTVSRGICTVGEDGTLQGVTERTKIEKRGDAAVYLDDDQNAFPLAGEEITSMNFWAFPARMMDELESGFTEFLNTKAKEDPLKAECYLPSVVDSMIKEGKCRVTVLETTEQWYGITDKEDKPKLKEAIRRMKQERIYPGNLFE